jgi:hypothetical protein
MIPIEPEGADDSTAGKSSPEAIAENDLFAPRPTPSAAVAGLHPSTWKRGAPAGSVDASSAAAPATTGEATDVPDSCRHPPSMRAPDTSLPKATTSGLTLPAPRGASHVVAPRLENAATAPSYPIPPTPMTSAWSAGLLHVP